MFIQALDNVILSLLLCLHMATGLTGAPIHQGSWFGLPDLGITEAFQGQLSTSPSPTGLSTEQYNPVTVNTNSTPTDMSPLMQQQTSPTSPPPGGGGPTTPPVNNTPSQPSGAPPYGSNTANQTVSYNGQTFKSDGNGGWVLQGAGGGVDEAAINAVYEPTMNYLNQAEGAVRADFPNVLDAAQKAYESAIQELSGNKQKNATTIQQNVVSAGQQKEDALSAARRLYDELRRGYQQRFGGSTSAGQAASEISAAEQMRQQGGIQRDYSQTYQKIQDQSKQLETDYQTGSMKILESKTQAIAQANRDFQNQLLTIAGQRAQTESAKAGAKLDALNTLRNQAYAAQQQALTYQQNLDMFYKQQQADLQSYAAKLTMAGQGSQTAINQFLPQQYVTSNSQVQSSGGQNTTGGMTGQISSPTKKDPLTGAIQARQSVIDPITGQVTYKYV